MGSFKAVLFDLDGTLLDTAPDLTQAINHVLAEHNRPPTTEAAVRPTVSSGATGMLCNAFNLDRKHPALDALKEACLKAYANCLTEKTTFFPGIVPLLDELNEAEIPWGVVTNKPLVFSKPLMEHFEPLRQSHCLVAGDSLPTRKPDPATLLYAAELIHTPPRKCIYVGDARSDIQAARAATMHSIAAAYGYVPTGESPENWNAHKIIYTPNEIKNTIKHIVA